MLYELHATSQALRLTPPGHEVNKDDDHENKLTHHVLEWRCDSVMQLTTSLNSIQRRIPQYWDSIRIRYCACTAADSADDR